MGELHTKPRHLLSGTDHEFYFGLYVVPHGYQIKGEGDCGCMAQVKLAYSGRVGLIIVGQLPTYERGTSRINPRAGEFVSLS